MARTVAVADAEEAPEADRLEGFPHPRFTEKLHGHEAAERALAEAFASGRMHHAWIVSGRQGTGKAALAYHFAAYVLASPHERQPGAGTPLAVRPEALTRRQVRALSHPGLFILRRPWHPKEQRFSAAIPVEEVRRLHGFLGHRAAEGAWRVVIADTADDLNINAANALLKLLEEPPPLTVFLLLAQAPGRLLATIRSRCRLLQLTPLTSSALREAVSQTLSAAGLPPPPEDRWPDLERLAEGSVGRALSLITGGGLELYERLLHLLSSLDRFDWVKAHGLAEELAPAAAEQRFGLFFDLLLAILAGMVRAAATGEGTPQENALARRYIPQSRLATWAALWETIGSEKAQALALNLDRRMLILDTFSRIEAAAEGALHPPPLPTE